MSPLVSILLPSYNHAEFLGECLASVKAQTYPEWELIAVDDLSTDNSFEVLQGFEGEKVTVVRNEVNLGTYGTLEKALQMAQGAYVAVLNSDDWWSPEKLQLQVELLEACPNLQACYTGGHPVTRHGTRLDPPIALKEWPKEQVQELLPYLLAENHVLASSVMIRKANAFFHPDLRYSGDWVAMLVAARSAPVGFIEGPHTLWRQHGHNTHRRSPGQVAEEERVRESILDQATLWEVPRLPRAEVRRGLAECAIHLSALYALQERIHEARSAARAAVRFSPSQRSLRRLAIVSLPAQRARRRLWRAEPALPDAPRMPPIQFP